MILPNKCLSYMEIDLTTECNFRCPLCISAGSINSPKKEMDENLLFKILGEIKYPTIVNLLGGEPLMYFNGKQHLYDKIFSYPHVIPKITTNGSLLYKHEKLLENMKNHSWNLVISAEGFEENYNKYRKGGSWERFLSNLKLLESVKENNLYKNVVSINYIATKETIDDLMPFIQKIEHYSAVDNLTVTHLIHSKTAEKLYDIDFKDYYIKDIDYYQSKIMDVVNYLHGKKSNLNFSAKSIGKLNSLGYNVEGYEPWQNKFFIDRYHKDGYCCLMPYQMFVVDWDGTVAPCCGGRNLIMGNCNKNNIYDIWNGEIYQKLRDEVIETKPIYCTCSAIHNSSNYSSSDDSQTSNNLQCEYKSIVEKFKSMIETDIDKAIQFIEQQQIFDFDRNSIIIWNELAGVLVHRKKDYLKAQKYIDKILNIDPYNIAAIIKQANILIYTEKYEDAIIKLSHISEVLKKEYPFINFWLGYAYEMQGKMDLAISYYRLFTDDIEKDSSWGYKHAEEVLSLYDTPQ